jgi:glycosyltransferase involved in cell wall biosynthesis
MLMTAGPQKIGLVHDWLTGYAGGERVLEQMIGLYPDAELYTTIDTLGDDDRGFLQGRRPTTTFAQHVPFMRKHYRRLLPILMFAAEQLDVGDCDLILSSSVAVARGVLTGPDQLHIAYVHSPMRYAWDLQHQYLREAGLSRGSKSLLARRMLHWARIWDLRTANGVDHFIANSRFIARRIWKVYRRPATVIYPPVDLAHFTLRTNKEDFYLTASRMVPYKKIPTIVEAFRAMPDRRLVVVGDGPEYSRVKARAGANVEILGYQSSAALRNLMQRAKAFVFAAEEDFGIAPVEAQACGTPVIAFAQGGVLESVRGVEHRHPTGLFFHRQEPEAIVEAIREFERQQELFEPNECRNNSLRFSIEAFRANYSAFVQRCWEDFHSESRISDIAEDSGKRLNMPTAPGLGVASGLMPAIFAHDESTAAG